MTLACMPSTIVNISTCILVYYLGENKFVLVLVKIDCFKSYFYKSQDLNVDHQEKSVSNVRHLIVSLLKSS